jgi:hypothetical protein
VTSALSSLAFPSAGHDHGETCVCVPAAHFARVVHIIHPRRKPRAQGRPGGRMHPGRRAKKICASAMTTGTGGDNRPSLRSGLRLIRALLGEPAFATVVLAKLSASLGLSACIGAPGPHDFAVRVDAARLQHLRVHRMPASRVVTFAIRPLLPRRDASNIAAFQKIANGIFFDHKLDVARQLDSTRQISILAHALSRA